MDTEALGDPLMKWGKKKKKGVRGGGKKGIFVKAEEHFR